jgi:hypothetical protein
MAEKFNPAAHDKHAADPREAARADRETHEKLEAGLVDTPKRVPVGQGARGFQVKINRRIEP